MRIFINSGHYDDDSGVYYNKNTESDLAMKVRDLIVWMLKKHIEVISVPDNLNLKQTIAWINKQATPEDLAFSIHFNSNVDKQIGGTEVYYYNDREREIAEIFARNVSSALNIKNRGDKADKFSWVGSLGWLRQLKCDSVLVEVCYLTNATDMLNYSPEKTARGLKESVLSLIPPSITKPPEVKEDLDCKKQVSNLMAIINWLVGIVNSLLIKK